MLFDRNEPVTVTRHGRSSARRSRCTGKIRLLRPGFPGVSIKEIPDIPCLAPIELRPDPLPHGGNVQCTHPEGRKIAPSSWRGQLSGPSEHIDRERVDQIVARAAAELVLHIEHDSHREEIGLLNLLLGRPPPIRPVGPPDAPADAFRARAVGRRRGTVQSSQRSLHRTLAAPRTEPLWRSPHA